jgi:transcriptional regulator with XRE-family HTH domain
MAEKVATLDERKLLTQDQVAKILGVSTNTLEAWRYKKRYGLKYLKIGSLIRYEESSVISFLESRRRSGDRSDGQRRGRRQRRAA